MAYHLDDKLVIGVSSRALFDLRIENEIFEQKGVEAYCRYQIEHENEILNPGPGFWLIKSLLDINRIPHIKDRVEVIIMSKNSPDTSLRIFHSIRHYRLPITRAVLSSGGALSPYLKAFKTDLFLSADEMDVQNAINDKVAAGVILNPHGKCYEEGKEGPIKIAFDGDAVLFSDESERIFQEKGLLAFEKNEECFAKKPLQEGPFAKFLKTISILQKEFLTEVPIRTALVTARSAPAHERVIRTLRSWNVRIDEVFFLGGIEKRDILKAFGAHIFFEDQMIHALSASEVVFSARVPYIESA